MNSHDDAIDATTSGDVPAALLEYPDATLTPAEFEGFVAATLRMIEPSVDEYRVELHEVIEAADGSYDFDCTVRFRFAGMDFLILVEAKQHRHPIKRETIQVLHAKVQSVHAQKGLVISTAKFQSGAIAYAVQHGIALVHVTTEGAVHATRNSDAPEHHLAPDAIMQAIGVRNDRVRLAVVSEHPAVLLDVLTSTRR